jgi:hypothetical protein
METLAQLAGFLAAHAILCVSRGQSLTLPLLVVEKADGTTQFIEITGKTSQEAVTKASRLMEKPAPEAQRSVMAFEAYLNLPPGRSDAIFLRGCCYQPEPQELIVAVPFRLASHPQGFAVFKPKFIAFEDDPVKVGALEAFFRGVAMHPPGKTVWSAHLDESR